MMDHDGSTLAAALPAAWVLVLAARSFFAELAAAAWASVALSGSGSHTGAAAGVDLVACPRSCAMVPST